MMNPTLVYHEVKKTKLIPKKVSSKLSLEKLRMKGTIYNIIVINVVVLYFMTKKCLCESSLRRDSTEVSPESTYLSI